MTDTLILDEFSKNEVDAGKQQLIDSIENASENDRVKTFAQTHKEKISQETERISEGMGQKDKIIRHNEPVGRFPENEKTEQRLEDEKKESAERRVNTADGDYLKELEKDLANCRKVCADVEYRDGKEIEMIRKRLGSKSVEESIAMKNSRDQYQKALDRFKDAKIEELKSKNLSEDALENEMAELIKYFGFMENVEYNSAKNDASAELRTGGNVFKQCWGLLEKTSNAYNKLPMWKKLGLSAAAVAIGAGIATGAAATAGVAGIASFAVGVKRGFGGVVAGVGTAKGLDALHQRSMGKTAKKDAVEVFEKIDKETLKNEEKKYEAFRAALDAKLSGVDERLKNQKMVSLCNKFIGVSVGIFLGTGMASKVIGGVVNHFHHSEQIVNTGTKHIAETTASKVPTNVHSSDLISISEPVKDASGHMHHDSFARNLKNYLMDTAKEHGHFDKAEIKHMTDLTFRDAMANYADTHHISYDEAVAKLSRIQPGTTYEMTWDSNGHPHMHISYENTKFMKGVKHMAKHITHNAGAHHGDAVLTHSDAPKPVANLAEAQPSQGDFVGDVNTADANIQDQINHLNQHQVELGNDIPKYEQAFNASNAYQMEGNQGYWSAPALDGQGHILTGQAIEAMKIDMNHTQSKLLDLFVEKGILESPDLKKELFHMRYYELFNKNTSLFKNSINMKVGDFLSNKDGLPKLPKNVQGVWKSMLKDYPAKSSETTGAWSLRVAEMFHKALEAKK